VLTSGGIFAFSVEAHEGEGVELGAALRFSHSAEHVRTALQGAGLKLLGLDSASTRMEKGHPVPGLIAAAVAEIE
jgi:predicted TPR repeat methyltransferase